MSFFGSVGGILKKAAPIALGALLSPAAGAVAGGLLNGGGGDSNAPPGSTGGFSGPYAVPDDAMGIEEGGLSGLLHKGQDWITGNGGKNALGAVQGLNAVLQQNKAADLAKRALGSAEGAYNERAPLRAQALSGLAGVQQGNVYAGGR